MIRVLHLISSLDAGGAQTMLYNVVAGSDASGFSHHIVGMMDGGSHGDRLTALGVPVETLGARRGRFGPASMGQLIRSLRRVRPHVVQTWLYHADLVGLAARPICGARVVWNIRSSFHYGLERAVTRACARLSRWPDAVVVNSAAGRQVHASLGYRPKRWCLIGNGFDLAVFAPDAAARRSVRAELSLEEETPLVGLIGRFDPHKDHATFFAAARQLAAARPDAHFLLAGDGVVRDNAALTAVIGEPLSAHVHLLGARADIARLTAALDVAACTSVGEGFPNVVGEAMASAVPCVSTDVGDTAIILGQADLVVPVGAAHAMAAQWRRLLDMAPEARSGLGHRLRERIAERYSLPVIVRQYEALYGSIVN